MENKKMPFAVFVLKWIENKIENYKKSGQDEFNVLDDLIYECKFCPISDKCDKCVSVCRINLKEYVESAE